MRKRDSQRLGRARRIAPAVGRTAVMLALLACATGLPGSARALGPGDPAPGFTLPDAYDMQHSLEASRGKVVLLAFVGYS